jgi:transposase-like protein
LLRWELNPEAGYGNERRFSREFKLEALRLVKGRQSMAPE